MTGPAQPAGDLEKKVRSEIWNYLSPGLANAAGLSSVSELLEWVSGSRRLSHQAVVALARKMNFVTGAATGTDVLRDAVAARLKRDRFFTKSMLDELKLDLRDLSDFAEGFDIAPAKADGLAKLMLDATFDPAANVLRPIKPQEAKPLGVVGPSAVGRPVAEIVGEGCERLGLSWNPAARAPKTVGSPPPKEGPVWPGKPGWA